MPIGFSYSLPFVLNYIGAGIRMPVLVHGHYFGLVRGKPLVLWLLACLGYYAVH